MPKISLPDSYKFWRVFFDRCTLWRKRRWNSLYGHFSRKERVRTCIEQSESERAPINAVQSAGWQHGPRSGRMSLKKCVFGCEGKITLFSFPKQPTVTWTVDIVCFSGAAMEFLKCFCWRTFYKQGPIRRWICTSFNTERWSGPSYKRSRSWFRTADGEWNGIKWLFCWQSEQVLVTL